MSVGGQVSYILLLIIFCHVPAGKEGAHIDGLQLGIQQICLGCEASPMHICAPTDRGNGRLTAVAVRGPQNESTCISHGGGQKTKAMGASMSFHYLHHVHLHIILLHQKPEVVRCFPFKSPLVGSSIRQDVANWQMKSQLVANICTCTNWQRPQGSSSPRDPRGVDPLPRLFGFPTRGKPEIFSNQCNSTRGTTPRGLRATSGQPRDISK
jgi:hypothetical protein